ncbi:spore germination protein [Gracilibacillus halophilus YIM-C55.5]|uniref:Spore germination protein n=1 Tax=Gracilibacillus halophilus YIM-C55.5 TaxID=1308866 RepID=N4WQA2_9BACI|nr:Ger(x)C family spore germination protein [Gracilibacillus halophilus]ENH96630.1 spore germination protein [Gracilibacillus halophilus YIM-C55.5]
MARRLLSCSFLVLTMIFLSGCWDENPIENFGFVIGSALDLGEDHSSETPSVTLTNQFAVPSGFTVPSQGGGGNQQAYKNLSVTGNSVFHMNRDMSKETSLTPIYDHLKLIVVSSELAQQEKMFSSVVDFFLRDHEMRRGIRIVVSESSAKSIFDIVPKYEKTPALYVNSIMKNNTKTIEVIPSVRTAKLHRDLLNKSSFVIPIVKVKGEEIKSEGGAIFNGPNNKMVGKLNAFETKGYNLIKGKINGGVINFQVDDQLMVYEIEDTSSKVKINPENPDQVKIDIKIEISGSVGEMFGHKTLINEDYQKEIKQKIEESIEELIMNVVSKAQQEWKVDIFGFDQKLKSSHSGKWRGMEGDWNAGKQLFTKSVINVSSQVTLEHIGSTDRTKDRGVK